MSANKLEIELTLNDELSPKLKNATKNLDEFASNMKSIGRSLGHVGSSLTFLGGSITGVFVAALVNAKDKSLAVKKSVDDLQYAASKFSVSLATSVIPVVENLTKFVTDASVKFEDLRKAVGDSTIQLAFYAGIYITLSGAIISVIKKVFILTGYMASLTSAALTASGALVVFSTFRLGGLLTDVSILTKNVGLLYPAVAIAGAAFAGWTIGKFIGEIKEVQWFFDWLMGADKAKRTLEIEEERNRAAVEEKQEKFPSENNTNTEDTSFIDERTKQMNDYIALYQAMSDQEIAIEQQKNITKVIQAQDIENQLTTILQKEVARRRALEQANVQVAQTAIESMSEMIGALAGKSKAAFFLLKALRVAEIIVNGQAAAGAISAVWAWNPAVEASLLAKNTMMTVMRVATVLATAIAGLAQGTDTVPAMLSPGEMVVPRSFASAIRSGDLTLGGPSGGGGGKEINNVFNIEINNPTISSRDNIAELAEQLGFEIERSLRGARSLA